jgi:hypothetical protein
MTQLKLNSWLQAFAQLRAMEAALEEFRTWFGNMPIPPGILYKKETPSPDEWNVQDSIAAQLVGVGVARTPNGTTFVRIALGAF